MPGPAANLYWPQKITEIVTGWGLTPLGFILFPALATWLPNQLVATVFK